MAKVIARAIGLDGQVALLVDRVVIRRDGLWNVWKYGFNSQREIPLAAISEVAFRDAGTLIFGSIEFVRSGRSTDDRGKGNSIVKFNKRQREEFEFLKEKIFELMEQYNRHQQ